MEHGDFSITVNGRPIRVAEGTSVAAAMMMANEPCRFSVRQEARAPFCGMGICMECRATVNGVPHQRTCQLVCTPKMEVVTG
jgi:sarcosine oxidase subunit alpha